MALKILGGVVALSLVIVYLVPVMLKLKDWALGAVILIGIAMMLVDLYQSLKKEE